jgi:Tfp pilus assembly protein PilN
MKIYLDLLPEEKKKEIKIKKNFFKLIRSEVLLSVPIGAFFCILAVINFSQDLRISALDTTINIGNSQKEYKELESYEEKFSLMNTKVSALYKIQENHLNWSDVFQKINAVVPENVYISGLSTTDYHVSLVGKAKTRDDFLKFQDQIKNESCFTNVEVPLSNLVSKENVGFQVNIEIGDACLKNKEQ